MLATGNRNNSRGKASMAYYAVHRRPHRTMTELEQAKVLKVTGEHARGSATMSSSPWPWGPGCANTRRSRSMSVTSPRTAPRSSAASPCASSSAVPSGLHRRRSSFRTRSTTSSAAYSLGRSGVARASRPRHRSLSLARAIGFQRVWRGPHSGGGSNAPAWTRSIAFTYFDIPRVRISIARRAISAWSSASPAT
jgi:hypothetical protein